VKKLAYIKATIQFETIKANYGARTEYTCHCQFFRHFYVPLKRKQAVCHARPVLGYLFTVAYWWIVLLKAG